MLLNDRIYTLLFQLIKNNGSIENIVNQGYSYSQVANFINQAVTDKYVSKHDGMFNITEEGKQKFNQLSKIKKRFKINSWISSQEQYKIRGLSKFDIYLPKK